MEKTFIKQKLNFGGNNVESLIETINKCPYCNNLVTPKYVQNTCFAWNEKNKHLYIFHWMCPNAICDKHFITFNEITTNKTAKEKYFKYIEHYPNTIKKLFSNNLKQMSPRFIDLYNQSLTSQSIGNFDLSAIGYRAALEVLIKDYAKDILKRPVEEINDKDLFNSIKDYIPEFTVSADVVRILGNDYAHYIQRYDETDFHILIHYMKIFINLMESKFPPTSKKGKIIARNS